MRDKIQNIDIVNTGCGDMQKAWNGGLHIVKSVKFDSSFSLSEFSPPKDT